MKAITICNPWPYLICLPRTDPRHKRVENRNWSTQYRGEIAIHAGKSTAWLGGYDLQPGEDAKLVYGAVVGVAELVACLHIRQIRHLPDSHPLAWLKTHEHAEGPWCWVLLSIRTMVRPELCEGHQSLWEWNPQHPLELLCVDEARPPQEAAENTEDTNMSKSNGNGAADGGGPREDVPAANTVPAMDEDAAHGELRRANAALHAAKAQYADAKEVAKDKRKNMDGAQERVNAAVDRICGIQVGLGPLFETEDDDEDGDEDDDQVEEGRGGDLDWVDDGEETQAAGAAQGPAGPAADDDEAWRAVRLDSLASPAIKPAILRALGEHEPPIITMGDLTNWQAAKGDFWAKDIRGIGPSAEGAIAEAAEAYWERQAQAAASRETA